MYFSQYDPIQTFTLTNSSYSAAFYITYCDIQTLNTANGIMGMTVSNYASNYPDIDMEISFVGSLSYASVTYRVLVFYPLLAKEKYNIDVSVVSHMHLTSPYVFDVGFDKFKTGTSIFFMALKAFNYEAVNNATNDGFKYSHTFTSDSTYQIIASTTLDNQFNKMAQVYILIHKITCPPTHPIRGINRISLA